VHELGRADGPTLVLLHGFTDSGLCWPDAAQRWRGDYRIIAPDARGHGESPRFDTITSGSNRSEVMVADLVSLLEGLTRESDQLLILVGHSMGAGIAASVLAPGPIWSARRSSRTRRGSPGRKVLTSGQSPDTTQQWTQSFRATSTRLSRCWSQAVVTTP